MSSGFTGEATVEVAALSRDSLGSDAEPLVRAMLSEQGIDVPVIEDEDSEYRVLLLGFGYWDLPIHYFEGPFYVRIPAWDDQGAHRHAKAFTIRGSSVRLRGAVSAHRCLRRRHAEVDRETWRLVRAALHSQGSRHVHRRLRR